MAASQSGRGLVALFKRGCHEIPEIMGAAFMAVVGMSAATWAIYEKRLKFDPLYTRYKHEYIVIRDDDPRVKFIRHD